MSEVEEEIEVREVDMITGVGEELGCYHWFYIYINFIQEYGLDNREEQVGMEPDPDEDDIKDVVPDDKRERH